MRKLAIALVTLAFTASAALAATAEQKQLAFETVERNAQTIADISDSIFYFGELGMQEVESTKLVQDTLKAAGFRIELGGAGMPTNLWAEYGEGRPKIAVVTELDALPGGSQTPGAFDRKPLVTDAVTKNIAVRWRGHDEVTPNRQNGFVVFSEAFAKRTDVARAWTVAYVRGLRDYNDAVRNRRGREEIYQILMENTSVKDRAVYDRMVLPGMHPDGELNVASIREALSDFRASGDVKADIDLDQVVDLSFIRYARQVLGPYPR